MRAEAFPRRLCRACCSHMCTSLIDATSSNWACESRRSAQPSGNIPLAAKKARLPLVPVASGDALRTRGEACVARACCVNGSLLFTAQELQLRFGPRMELAPLFRFSFARLALLQVYVRMLRCKARASAGASWRTLSANMKTVTELCVREALHPCWWLWETVQSLLCLE